MKEGNLAQDLISGGTKPLSRSIPRSTAMARGDGIVAPLLIAVAAVLDVKL